MSWRVALMWGTVIVAVVLGVLVSKLLCLVESRSYISRTGISFPEHPPSGTARNARS